MMFCAAGVEEQHHQVQVFLPCQRNVLPHAFEPQTTAPLSLPSYLQLSRSQRSSEGLVLGEVHIDGLAGGALGGGQGG